MQENVLPGKLVVIVSLIALYLAPSTLAQITAFPVQDSSCSSHTWTYVGIGGAVLLTAVMMHYDQKIYNELYTWKTNTKIVGKISPVITNLGDGSFSFGLFGGFVGYGLIFKNEKACEVGKIGLESFLLTGVTVQLLKHLCGRERPSAATREGGVWHGPFSYLREPKKGKGISSFDAFPSGHTATVFACYNNCRFLY